MIQQAHTVGLKTEFDFRHAVTGNAKHGDGVSFTIDELAVRHRDSFLAG